MTLPLRGLYTGFVNIPERFVCVNVFCLFDDHPRFFWSLAFRHPSIQTCIRLIDSKLLSSARISDLSPIHPFLGSDLHAGIPSLILRIDQIMRLLARQLCSLVP